MILTITPNPTLDRTLLVRNYTLGVVHRSAETLLTAGGKGLNVARVTRALGQPALALGLAGGLTGQLLVRMSAQEGLPCEFADIAGETRCTTIVIDPSVPSCTVINEMGPVVDETEWACFVALLQSRITGADYVTLNGSLPRGLSSQLIANLVHSLGIDWKRVAVDTSGETLRIALTAAPWLLKVNCDEAAQALGYAITTTDDALRVAREMRRRGSRYVILTMGATGAIISADEGEWLAVPPPVVALSTIGSGDTLLAGWLVALQRGEPVAEALRLGVAVAAANVLTLGAGYFRQQDLDQLLPQVQMRQLS